MEKQQFTLAMVSMSIKNTVQGNLKDDLRKGEKIVSNERLIIFMLQILLGLNGFQFGIMLGEMLFK